MFRTDEALAEASRTHAVETAGDTMAALETALPFDPMVATIMTALQSARAWYDVKLLLPGGKTVSAGRHIASKAEAERVVENMKDAIVNA